MSPAGGTSGISSDEPALGLDPNSPGVLGVLSQVLIQNCIKKIANFSLYICISIHVSQSRNTAAL